MDRGLIDWLALALIFILLGLVAYGFSRRTYRLVAFAAIVLGVAAVTWFGLSLGPQPANYLRALEVGGNEVAREMFGQLAPGRIRDSLVPGLWGWLALLVLAGGLLVAFDTLSTHRLPPSVRVGDVPLPLPGPAQETQGPGASGLAARRMLTEELKFRLPAVQVRAPASMPGGSALESLATVVSDSGVQGSKVTAGIMLAVHALEARPRSYYVNTFVEYCGPDGQVDPAGQYLQTTVDLRDVRTGQSLAARVLRPCPPEEAAEMVAGFTARQVFCQDITTPAWAVGSLDGEDLSAYLITREMRPAGHTFADLYGCRERQRARLEDAVCRSTNSGLVQYELASIYDLDDRPLDALTLHLDNRLHHPRFLRARYRLAMSLSMLASEAMFGYWADPAPPTDPASDGQRQAGVKAEIIRQLRWAGMLRAMSRRDLARLRVRGTRGARNGAEQALADLLAIPHPGGDQARRVRHALLLLARREFAAYRRHLRATHLLWWALRHRPERAASLELLRSSRGWWRHPRRRLWPAMIALEIVDARLTQLERSGPEADRQLAVAQQRVRRRLGLDRTFGKGRAWRFGAVPWQAMYNAACLHALPSSDGKTGGGSAGAAVWMLRLAISDSACELDRPSEWISADPDLRPLRGHASFRTFVREQARRDFTPAADNSMASEWLRDLLPSAAPAPVHAAAPAAVIPAAGTGDGRQPAAAGWLHHLVRPRHPHPDQGRTRFSS